MYQELYVRYLILTTKLQCFQFQNEGNETPESFVTWNLNLSLCSFYYTALPLDSHTFDSLEKKNSFAELFSQIGWQNQQYCEYVKGNPQFKLRDTHTKRIYVLLLNKYSPNSFKNNLTRFSNDVVYSKFRAPGDYGER